MQLNVEKTVFKKIKFQVKVLPMEKTGVFPTSHLPHSSGQPDAPGSKPADLCGILHCPEQPQLSRVVLLPTSSFKIFPKYGIHSKLPQTELMVHNFMLNVKAALAVLLLQVPWPLVLKSRV